MKSFKLSQNVRNSLFVLAMALFAFFAFEPLLENLGLKATQEYAIAIFGTIIAAVITMLLLTKQTETEEQKDRNDKVFEQKITIYNQVIDTIQSIFEKSDDNNQVKISRKEIVQIEFLLAKIMMVGGSTTIIEFKNFYQTVMENYSPETETLTLNPRDRQIVFRFVDYCREELGLSDKKLEKSVLEEIVLHGELFYNMEGVADMDDDTVETLKDIYAYLVFDLNMPYKNIDIVSNGFNAYTGQKRSDSDCFIKCAVNAQDIYLTLNNSHAIKEFETRIINNQNVLVLKPSHRGVIERHFDKIEKAINDSYLKIKK